MDALNGLLERFKLTGDPKIQVINRRQSATDWLRGVSRLTIAVDIGEMMVIELEVWREKALRVPSLQGAKQSP